MPTHDYIIANGTGAAVRADINLALSAIVSLNSSASEPGTMYAYQLWADTAAGLLKIRNGANSAWITLRQLDGDFSIVAVEDGLQATPSLTFTNDLNTGVFRSGADALAIVTGGQYAIACTSTQAVGIRTANPNAALHVAGPTRVGADDATDAVLEIGAGASGNRNSFIDIVADTTYTDYGLRIIRNNTGANATSELKHRGTGALNITTQEAAPIVFNTTNSPALTILAGGNVGIGNSSPRGIIHVGADLHNGATDAAAINLKQTSTTAATGIYLERSAERKGYYIYLGGSEDSLNFQRNSSGTKSDVMTLTRDGLVGIGTTSPGSYSTYGNKLVVYGTGTNGPGITIATGAADTGSLYFADGTTGNEVARGAVSYSHGDDALLFQTSATEKVRIDSSGRLLVGTVTQVGNVNGGILQLGSGITFPATPVATTDVNTLDDYEEGTWEPRIADDGTAFVGTTYTARNGLYRKIGSLVYVSYDIDVLLAGTLTGNASIGNLPFPVPNSTDLRNGGGSIGYITGLQQNYVYQSNFAQNNSTYLYIIGRTAASSATTLVSSSNFFANSMRITGQAWYSV